MWMWVLLSRVDNGRYWGKVLQVRIGKFCSSYQAKDEYYKSIAWYWGKYEYLFSSKILFPEGID